MITAKEINSEYAALMDDLTRNKSLGKSDRALITMGVMTFMKRLQSVIDENLDDAYHGSLQEEE